jgi:hypothetical protein
LHFLYFSSAFRARLAYSILGQDSFIAARLAKQINFIIPPALAYDLGYCLLYDTVQLFSLASGKVIQRMFWMELCFEQDILGNGISQAWDDLVLCQKTLDASFF